MLSFVPAVCTASVSSGCFAAWTKFRRGRFPGTDTILTHFSVCLLVSFYVSQVWIEGAFRKRREALKRLNLSSDSVLHMQYEQSGASKISQDDLDGATGTNGEDEARKAFQLPH